MIAALLIALVAPSPLFESDDATLRSAAEEAWPALLKECRVLTGRDCPAKLETLRIDYDDALPSRQSGRSGPARIRLRLGGEALRHELAHQLLSSFCPSGDALMQEAFALRTSGELELWRQAPYQTLAQALQTLHAQSLDVQSSRAALARLLFESGGAPAALRTRLASCAAGGVAAALTPEALLGGSEVGAAWVVLNRHSGETLIAQGATTLAMPPGSTLKAFIIAGHDDAPELATDATRAEWRCGKALGKSMRGNEALWRSCNGYFLDWGVRDYGAFAPLLQRLSGATPSSPAEAIGLTPTLRLSPRQLAEAYRALATAKPEVLQTLRETTRKGTLAGITALQAWSTKTGTVREPDGSVRVGWIVAVNDDFVSVRAVPGQMPRDFAKELGARLAALAVPAQEKTSVQVFGLLPLAEVALSCPGVAMQGLDLSAPSSAAEIQATALCLGAPWLVTIDGQVRRYQGVFERSPAPPLAPADSDRHAHARRGSDIVFSTSLALYTGGVLLAEDAAIEGQARRALGSVIAHNAKVSRHFSLAATARPLCDTTHCQAFLGTAPLATRLLPLPGGFLSFSRGGDEPWQRRVSKEKIAERFGDVRDFHFSRATARLIVADDDGGEALRDVGCELVRAPLLLPSCPERAESIEGGVIFFGRGRGHGLGLDVEAAKHSQARAEVLLQRAYRE